MHVPPETNESPKSKCPSPVSEMDKDIRCMGKMFYLLLKMPRYCWFDTECTDGQWQLLTAGGGCFADFDDLFALNMLF